MPPAPPAPAPAVPPPPEFPPVDDPDPVADCLHDIANTASNETVRIKSLIAQVLPMPEKIPATRADDPYNNPLRNFNKLGAMLPG
jgi:hypothetical protein